MGRRANDVDGVDLGAVRKNKRRALIGPDAHLFDAAARISPRASQWALGKVIARSSGAIV